jgi:multiple antibiotic resistance protein
LADQAHTLLRQASLYGAILITGLASYVTLREAHRVVRLLGQIGINVFSRLMGLILAAIAVQFMIDGIRGAMKSSLIG